MQKPIEGAALGIITLALSLATFMQVLDSTIANVAIPTISGDLGASFSQGTWVITSFGVANAISIPITGWLAKRFGEVKLFLISTALFVLASWLCGISHSLEIVDSVPYFPRISGRPDYSAVSEFATSITILRKTGHGIGILGNDHSSCTDFRSHSRRLDQ